MLDIDKVLTTNHIAALEFPTVDRAQHRLTILWKRELVWRWRPTLVWAVRRRITRVKHFGGGKLRAWLACGSALVGWVAGGALPQINIAALDLAHLY